MTTTRSAARRHEARANARTKAVVAGDTTAVHAANALLLHALFKARKCNVIPEPSPPSGRCERVLSCWGNR